MTALSLQRAHTERAGVGLPRLRNPRSVSRALYGTLTLLESCLSQADVYLLERRTSVNPVNDVR